VRRLAVTFVALAVLAGCASPAKKAASRDTTPRGGTLHVAESNGISDISTVDPPYPALDPQMEYGFDVWELLRCCLVRTLLSHDGHTTEQGGARLRPDLAASMPTISADGRTWTFALKHGIHYAPPLQNVEVTAGDFIRAFRREAKISTIDAESYAYYYSPIEGFDTYASGKADSISGLEAPDPYTLVIRLTQPQGDLGYRLVLPATAPIPPQPGNPGAPFGVATGHDKDGYGGELVATGPYMVEGSEKLDFSQPPAHQPKLSGLSSGKFITLVRNPSWNSSTDGLRAAYPDRIEITFPDEDQTAIANKILAGSEDVDLTYTPPPPDLLALAQRLRGGEQSAQVHVASRDFIRYVSMNLAVPPFDDLAVRRAVNQVIDKAAVQRIRGGPLAGVIADHVAFDSMENNLLVSYDPYPSPGNTGNVGAARAEMAKSRYDTNHDGVCDATVCRDVLGLTVQHGAQGYAAAARQIAHDMAAIGIHVRVVPQDPGKTFGDLMDPKQRVPLGLAVGWGKDYLNASDFIDVLFTSSAIGTNNYSLLGATPAQLRSWGYPVTSVPAIDDRIGQCRRLSGDSQTQCWSSLDQYLMEQVVPWVPLLYETKVILTSSRVVAYSFDQFANEASLDRLALRPGS